MNYTKLFCTITLLALIGLSNAGTKQIIDNFFGDITLFTFDTATTVQTGFFDESTDPLANFQGTERDLLMESPPGSTPFADFFASTGGGSYGCFASANRGGRCTLTLDQVDTDVALNPGSLNFDIDANNALGIILRAGADVANTNVIRFYGSTTASFMEYTLNIDIGTSAAATRQDYFIPFTDFTSVGGFDFSTDTVQAVEFILNDPQVIDLDINVDRFDTYAQTISGCAFIDSNNDGLFDAVGETTIPNVTIELFEQGTTTLVQSQLTSTSVSDFGCYEFNVPPAEYTICAELTADGNDLSTTVCIDTDGVTDIPPRRFSDTSDANFGYTEPNELDYAQAQNDCCIFQTVEVHNANNKKVKPHYSSYDTQKTKYYN